MRRQKHADAVLGISATPTRIEAVLLQNSEQRFEVINYFSQSRTKTREYVSTSSLSSVLSDPRNDPGTDFTIQVGDGGDNADLFMSGEFVGFGSDRELEGIDHRASARQGTKPFIQPLSQMLAQCEDLGYPQPHLAFCVGTPDVAYVELHVPNDTGDPSSPQQWWTSLLGNGRSAKGGVDERRLLELLKTHHPTPFDASRVAFVPMTPLLGQQRYLAILPDADDPVTATLQALRQQQRTQAPASRLLSAEVPLYTTLVRNLLAPVEHENTAVIRIGSEDTLILFLSGTELRHFERLRSLTTYDPPETICSRVLLQQDEQKIGEIHRVLILSEGHPELFLGSFRKFYPTAGVEPLDRLLFGKGRVTTFGEGDLAPTLVPAIGIGLTWLEEWEKKDAFGAVNLLSKKLRQKKRQQLGYAWHTFVMLTVLFGLTFFFTWRYAERQAEIELSRAELQLLNIPNPTMGTATALQTRVDSLQNVYTKYTHALTVLDSLLIGSDQWTKTLEKTSRATRELPGIWFQSWQPTGTAIQIKGYAKSRESVAKLASLLSGAVHETAFADVNDVRIHPFTIVVPRSIGIPMVAEYLKETVTAPPVERTPGAAEAQQVVSGTPTNQ